MHQVEETDGDLNKTIQPAHVKLSISVLTCIFLTDCLIAHIIFSYNGCLLQGILSVVYTSKVRYSWHSEVTSFHPIELFLRVS